MASSGGKRTLLVTGGSGRLARQVIDLLLRQGTDRIVTTTRTPEQADDLRRRGVEVRRMDFDDDVDSIAAALAGADRMLMVSTHAVGRRPEQQGRVVTAAQRAGVGHMLYTSCASPNPNPISAVVSDHFWTERAIFASSMPWTILRHNMYSEHVFLFLPTALAAGQLRTSLGSGARSYITREDCAAADAAALLGTWTDSRIYDVGGPEALTTDDVLGIVHELTGKTIRHVPTSDAESLRDFAASGLPEGFPEAAVGFDICARYGYHAILAPAVRELTGRDPESLRAYLARHLDAVLSGRARVDL
ncbi:MAG TPA: NAD(P)H-binding protein [Steroidobacteraceae bacterium]|nr:NAD(P)H-binding protein [Steroidobacteraceae bacterium]HUO37013.1 NAD(P)H-binding protein [Mycobacterium sp.]